MYRTSKAIARLTGQAPKLMRPPYGALNQKVKDSIHSENLQIVLWDVDPQDWKKPGPDEIARRVLNAAKDGDIILLHDIHHGTLEAVPTIIDGLVGRGFNIVTAGELLDNRTKESTNFRGTPKM